MTTPETNDSSGVPPGIPMTVNYYEDGPGDMTGGQPHPAVLQHMLADREKIDLYNAWAKQRLEDLKAQRKQNQRNAEAC